MSDIPKDMNKLVDLIKGLLSYLQSKAKWVIGFGFFGIIVGFSYALLKKPTYEAKLIFMINDSKPSNIGNLGSVFGQLGLGGNSGLNVSEDRIFYLAFTRRIIGGALLNRDSKGGTLGDKFIEIQNLKNGWQNDTILNRFKSFSSKNVNELNFVESKAMDQLIQIILLSKRYIVDSYKKKVTSLVGSQNSGMMFISFEFKDDLFAKAFVIEIFNELSSFYSISTIKSLQNNYDLICAREDSLKQELKTIEDQFAFTADGNFQVNKFIGKVHENRLRRQLEILNLFYSEVIKNKEVARFNLDQEKPVFQIIDEPSLPIEPKFKSKAVYGTLAGIGFIMLSIGVFSLLYLKMFLKEKSQNI
jgi:hypothetical protein